MIRFESVTKEYTAGLRRRRIVALSDISLTFSPGEVVGIAGPNGAGKSTLISLLMGFLRPTSGQIRIFGRTPYAYRIRTGVGYLGEHFRLPRHWTVRMALHRLRALGAALKGDGRRDLGAITQRFGVDSFLAKRIGALSKGNLQRVGLAQVQLNEVEVVILDEPTDGLDPISIDDFEQFVKELRAPSRIVILASHDLALLERLVDRVAILDRGTLKQLFDVARSRANGATREWRISFEGRPDVLAWLPMARSVEGEDGAWLVTATAAEVSTALRDLFAAGEVIAECVPTKRHLAAAFRSAVAE